MNILEISHYLLPGWKGRRNLFGGITEEGSVVANRVLSGDYRKLIANEAGSFEYYRAFGGSGNFYCEIFRSLNTPPPPPLPRSGDK